MNSKMAIGIIAGSLGIFAIFTVILWRAGLFDFTGTEASSKVVASTIALVGGFFASLVGAFGIIMRLSIDQQNATLNEQAERRLTLDSERNANLQLESEKRLNMEAAISAVGLLSTESGAEVPTTQRAGVLFTLAQLGHIELSLTMLDQMLNADRIDPVTAAYVVDQGLKSSNSGAQVDAASCFFSHHESFLTDGSSEIPQSTIDGWNLDWPFQARNLLAQGLIQLMLCRPVGDWTPNALNGFAARLANIWELESDLYIKHGVGLCLNIILGTYPPNQILLAQSGPVAIDDLRSRLDAENQEVVTADFIKLNEDISRWITDTPINDDTAP